MAHFCLNTASGVVNSCCCLLLQILFANNMKPRELFLFLSCFYEIEDGDKTEEVEKVEILVIQN